MPPEQLTDRAVELCAAVLANPATAMTLVEEPVRGADQRDLATRAVAERSARVPLLRAMIRRGIADWT